MNKGFAFLIKQRRLIKKHRKWSSIKYILYYVIMLRETYS